MVGSKPSKKLGRKPKSRAVREELLENLRTGMSVGAAHTLAGVSETTYYRWIAEDEKWAEEVAAANCFGEAVMLTKLDRCAEEKSDWRAYAWRLSRRFPKIYGDQKQVDLNVTKQSDGSAEVLSMMKQIEALHAENETTSSLTADSDEVGPG
jgi:transposase